MKCIVIYAAGHSWTKLFQGYNILKGRGLVIGIDLDGCCIISDLQNQVVTRHYVRQ
jgi:hypothetical protein